MADMKSWLNQMVTSPSKKAMPILSFPCVSLMGITVAELIGDPELTARGMALVASRCDTAASVSMMDLSVEAEAFGAQVRVSGDEVPTITGALIRTPEDAEALSIPPVGAGRTGRYLEAIGLACGKITDRPVFAGVIGPFSLAGRLMDISQAMINCYEEPEMVHAILRKTTEFLIAYCNAYKQTGAGGVVIAEPLTGLLSPGLAGEFSAPYVRRLVAAVQTEEFLVIYHNCGNHTARMLDAILSSGAAGYHFGNAVDMRDILVQMPDGVLTMGNIDPAGQFKNGTPESIRCETLSLMKDCCPGHPHFVISSGCDIPPASRWENIDAFFAAVKEYYA